jgi:hypothetical protein
MWKPIVPVLAERFTANAPDLPGIGDSDTRKRCEASTRPQQNLIHFIRSRSSNPNFRLK